MPVSVSVRMDMKALQRDLDNFTRKQVPFATSQALNVVARKVQAAERDNMKKVLDRPTPFTLNSVAMRPSTKATLTATVFVKDIAAAYLLPYEQGGKNKLNSRALIKPVAQKVNQYGNLARTAVKRLAAKRGVFVGKVQTMGGAVDGVWQRTKAARGKSAGLKLLVKFQDAHDAKPRLGFEGVARKTVSASFRRELGLALSKAMKNARR